MHTHLPCIDDQHRVLHARDMSWPGHMTRDNQTARHVLDRKAGERACLDLLRPLGLVLGRGERGDGHVQHTALQVCHTARGSSASGGIGQNDVHVAVVANVNVASGREGGFANARAGLVGHLGVVILRLGSGKAGQLAEVVIVILLFRCRRFILIGDAGL